MTDLNQKVTEEELVARSQYPRVTFDELQANIVGRKFVQHDLLTICILTLANGFTVVGKSACAVPGNFKLDVGQRLAEQDAIGQVWPLMGYELKSKVALAMAAQFPETLGVKDESFIEPLKTYVGTKTIRATPMTLGHYNHHREWQIPSNEDPDRLGYMVQYPDGYVSWSPKEVFEASYQAMDITGEGSQGGPTWHDRLLVEKDELLGRLDKLTTFLAGPLFKGLDEEQQGLLMEQMTAMSSYFSILKLRIGEG